MHIIILPSVACLAVQYLPTLSHKQLDSRKQLLNIRRVFLFAIQLLSEMEHFSLLEELSEKWSKSSFGLNVKKTLFLYKI